MLGKLFRDLPVEPLKHLCHLGKKLAGAELKEVSRAATQSAPKEQRGKPSWSRGQKPETKALKAPGDPPCLFLVPEIFDVP